MFEFPFIGGTVTGNDSITFSPQRTVNLYPERDPSYKNEVVLHGFPGLEQWVSLGGPLRGGSKFKDHAVVVSGSAVVKIERGGFNKTIGSLTTSSGIVSMDENGLELMIVDGEKGFVWDGQFFREIIDSTFAQLKSDSVAYLDSAFIVNRPGTGQIYASDVLDAMTWDAAKTATAEYKSDHVIVVWSDRELMLGGDETVQMYFNSGATPMPFEPIRQGRLIYGIAAKNSVVIQDNTTHALFKNEHGGIFAGKMSGYNVKRISSRGLERFWSGMDFPDSYAFAMHWKGHEFYILTFPMADTGFGRTFAYDSSTGIWFELGTWESSIGDFKKYLGTFHLFFDDRHIIGGDDGNLYQVKDTVYTYGSDEIISLRRAPVIHNNRERVFFNKLQIDMDVGHGTNSGQGSDPVCRLEISDNGGRSFKNFRTKSIGQTGKHENRVQFHHLGSSYDRVFQFSVSDPVQRRFLGGYLS